MESKNRIKDNEEFKRLYKKSKRYHNRDYRILVANNEFNFPRFGFTITKKFGKANKRNKMRRKLKEIVRLNLDKFENKDYIITPKYHTVDYDYKELESSLLHLMNIIKKGKK